MRESRTSRRTSSDAAVETTSRIRNETRIRARTSPRSGRRWRTGEDPSVELDTRGRYSAAAISARSERLRDVILPDSLSARGRRPGPGCAPPRSRIAHPSAYRHPTWSPRRRRNGIARLHRNEADAGESPGPVAAPGRTGRRLAVALPCRLPVSGRHARRDVTLDLDAAQGVRVARLQKREVHDGPQSRNAEGLKGDRENPGGHGAPLSLGLCTRPRLAHDHERAMRAG